MDGPETAVAIRGVYEAAMLPVATDTEEMAVRRSKLFVPAMICCSAYDPNAISEKAREAGMKDVLPKPPTSKEFKQVIDANTQLIEAAYRAFVSHFAIE